MKTDGIYRKVMFRVRLQCVLVAAFTILLFLFMMYRSNAQSFQGSTFLEKNVSGLAQGYELVRTNASGWALGGFYENLLQQTASERAAGTYERYGVILQGPLVRCQKLGLYAQVKSALVKNKFLVIMPSLETQIRLHQYFILGFRSGLRYGHPSAGIKLILSI